VSADIVIKLYVRHPSKSVAQKLQKCRIDDRNLSWNFKTFGEISWKKFVTVETHFVKIIKTVCLKIRKRLEGGKTEKTIFLFW